MCWSNYNIYICVISLQDNQTLAGVVGIDIPVSRFEGFAPRNKLGPLGYAFGLNANGFLIFHPNLWIMSNYLEEPAHNDLADIEGDSVETLRRKMIDLAASTDGWMATKMININASVVLQRGHSMPTEVKYFYTQIEKTTFS
jgi:hypothetical protein